MPDVKEPQFFAEDICGEQRVATTIAEYLSYFADASTKAIGEASTCYLASSRAPYSIKDFCPEARIIVMLRNPIDVMYALHSERVFDGMEHIRDFAVAQESKETRRWRSGCFKGQEVVRLSYREITRFSQQVAKFFEVFGRSNVHIVLYEDFSGNTALAYRDVLAFLGVRPDAECSFDVVHANRKIRSTTVQDLLRKPPESVHSLVRAVLPGTVRRSLGKYLSHQNIKFQPRPALDPVLKKRLVAEYKSEVINLSNVIDQDLSSWIRNE
jgi:hypothetical protein